MAPLPGAAQPMPLYDLQSDSLAKRWDEAIPLGNAMLGALVWKKDERLRMSLDRADLWDLRPMKGLDRPEFSYAWIREQVKNNNYGIVQQYFDQPYETEPAPTKIPGAALEIDMAHWGDVAATKLSLQDALATITWEHGTTLTTFVHALLPAGRFRVENLRGAFTPELIPPAYEGPSGPAANSVEGDALSRLGYTQDTVQRARNLMIYRQKGWGGFEYEVAVQWAQVSATAVEGAWSISSHEPGRENTAARQVVAEAMQRGYHNDLATHRAWWGKYWMQSSIRVPDSLLERQWYLEQYKFGSASRRGAPPISLQAVWTADNGRIPPWKGDYHHDLNTQLSYWPAYSGNHLEEGLAYFDHLEANKNNYKRYTKKFFGTTGLAVPGVTTLAGTEMGGWTQYSLSPTVSAWLGHHYYLHWRYSMDRTFLRDKAYPWIRDAAQHLQQLAVKGNDGMRQLPLGSSPEINNNDRSAWFEVPTNYDLALMRFIFSAAAELAGELGLKKDAAHWKSVLAECPALALSPRHELMVAPGHPYDKSHRHFSHLMAIHPLGLVKWEDGPAAQEIIRESIHLLDSIGPDWWTGYSYAWLGNLKARAKDGEGASKTLKIFAKAFCLDNSFHVNGDQTKSGYSKFQYRPFTLEGNFAFAAGLQEMLLQSYSGVIEIMPAIPERWDDVSFRQLRAEGAFLVSATRSGGTLKTLTISAEQGGKTKLKLPFTRYRVVKKNGVTLKQLAGGLIELTFQKGGELRIQEGS